MFKIKLLPIPHPFPRLSVYAYSTCALYQNYTNIAVTMTLHAYRLGMYIVFLRSPHLVLIPGFKLLVAVLINFL